MPTTTPTTTATCPENIRTSDHWHPRTCGRPLRTDEQRQANLCGTHLAAQRRRNQADARRMAERAAQKAADDIAQSILRAVGDGEGRAAWAVRGGQVTLSVELAREVLDCLEQSSPKFRAALIAALDGAAQAAGWQPGTGYIVLCGQAWMNEHGSGINYDWDRRTFGTRQAAIDHGFTLGRSDDFNIGTITGGKLTAIGWMEKDHDTPAERLAEIAEELYINEEDRP